MAFSFGWIGYVFTSLISVIGDKQLVPLEPDCPSIVINCCTEHSRINRSWLLERIFRDYKLAVEDNTGPEYADLTTTEKMINLRIDICEVQKNRKPKIDRI